MIGEFVVLDQTDNDLVFYLAGCTLAKKAGNNNWVEEEAVGGLPEYICRIARAIHRDGSHSVSQSIAIAVGRVKTWARGGGGVNADTRAKAAKAVAEWERKKAAAKLNNKKVKMSNDDDLMLVLSKSYNIDDVRNQYRSQYTSPDSYIYVREMWSDYMIVSEESSKGIDLTPIKTYKVSYSVDKDGKATFGDRQEVKQAYVAASHPDLFTRLTDAQLELAGMIPCTAKDNRSLVENIAISKKMREEREELMSFAAGKPNLLKLIQEL